MAIWPDNRTVLYDSAGNPIAVELAADGDYHLAVTTIQDVHADSNNSSTTNLAAGNSYTFTGTGTSTLGVVGLQWSLKTDQNATVYIEESPDNSNWDISYPFDYIEAHGGRGETVQASSAYWRIRVVLTGTTDTTYFRLEGVLCPIAVPLPSELSPDGRCKVETTITGQQNTSRHTWVSPTNSLTTVSEVRLVGTNFDGQTTDPNFWTSATTGSGTVTQDGEIQLDTGVTANSTVSYTSVRKARFVVGSANHLIGAFKFVTAGTTDNMRQCGAYTSTDGFFFQLDGTVFSVATRKNSSDTLVSSGSFNGNMGDSFTPLTTAYYKLDIEWTPVAVFFYVNSVLLHQVGGGHLSDVLTLPIVFENINDNGNIVDVAFDCLGVVIMREGNLDTNPTFKYAGTGGLSNATHIIKYGAGNLHRVAVTDNTGTLLIYDGLSAAGVLIASLDASKTVGTMEFGLPFSDGLTVVVAGTPKMTIVYE